MLRSLDLTANKTAPTRTRLADETLPDVLQFMQLLWAVVHGLDKASKRMSAEIGVTGPQRLVLRVVGLFPGLSAGDLAAILHVHPSTLYPGGVGTAGTIQVFTDYLVRLMKYVEFMKKAVPLHDDLFDFMYEALPGYEKVGQRRILLGCWGSFQDPAVCDYDYRHMTDWGRAMFVTAPLDFPEVCRFQMLGETRFTAQVVRILQETGALEAMEQLALPETDQDDSSPKGH